MSKLDEYLSLRFQNAEKFAEACHITKNELYALVGDRLAPAPSYVVAFSSIVSSHVFGRMEATGSMDGSYFHPVNAIWVSRAQRVIAEVGRQQAYAILEDHFATNMRISLAGLNATTWRLRDSFDADGSAINDGLRVRIEAAWEHFLNGTFGLCVANPISEMAIAYKEVLQEKISELSMDGSKESFTTDEAGTLLELIDAYAKAAMPFSPIDYPISSRKRLVEHLSARIKAFSDDGSRA